MKQYFSLFLILLLHTSSGWAQTKSPAASKAQTATLSKMLSGSKLPFKMANDSLAVIPYEGDHIASYHVMVQQAGDLFIVFTSLSDALPANTIDETKYKYLLGQNHHFDLVKIGMDDEKTVFVRADVYRTNVNAAILKRLINQVGNVTNIIASELLSSK